ncbi:MAG TPA: hypothetical protein VFP97_13325, partial [Chitinophagaceae bacterium]|nr:hypothetical protein [Chitinophagaceae bacterium]
AHIGFVIEVRKAVAEKVPTFFKNPRRLLLGIVIVCINVQKSSISSSTTEAQGAQSTQRKLGVSLCLPASVVQEAQ